jgi:glyoxylase-like metal-dependent hydrolase (beta-lactamase superfamily II)/ferredoxin
LVLIVARPQLRLSANAPGPFFVDGSCIDCGTCWQWDPDHFAPAGAHAHVHRQPQGEGETRRALLALQACPVAAIGTSRELLRRTPADGFPALIEQRPEGTVMYCGWASRRSFGASSYLIVRADREGRGGGNVLIDSPRFNRPLVRRLEALGGLDLLLLSHRDDVADQQAFTDHFGCRRWIHAGDADAVPGVEHQVEGLAAVALDADLQLIPTPGHTAGSVVVLFADQILFSGDHLWWGTEPEGLVASRRYCWWDWQEQLRSVERLRSLDVRWLLPGHGRRRAFGPGEWRLAVEELLERLG